MSNQNLENFFKFKTAQLIRITGLDVRSPDAKAKLTQMFIEKKEQWIREAIAAGVQP